MRADLLEALHNGYGPTDNVIPRATVTLIGWDSVPQVDVAVDGRRSTVEATTLYFIELPFTSEAFVASGSVEIAPPFWSAEILYSRNVFSQGTEDLILTNASIEIEFTPWEELRRVSVARLSLVMEPLLYGNEVPTSTARLSCGTGRRRRGSRWKGLTTAPSSSLIRCHLSAPTAASASGWRIPTSPKRASSRSSPFSAASWSSVHERDHRNQRPDQEIRHPDRSQRTESRGRGSGSVVGFVGPNGAGKTTTMRILTTLLQPTSGSARVAGYSVLREPQGVRRSIGYMPDFFGVYEDMKVWEYLDFYAACYDIPAATRNGMIDDLLALVDLNHKREAFVESLSRGMKQRLCLARTLAHDPQVLFLDEPASGLDPRARIEMRELLRELKNMGKTIFFSSHILSEVADICTTVAVLEAGDLIAYGDIAAMKQRLRCPPRG